MLLVIEIMLTASAWNKGWKGLALVPWAIMFALAWMVGTSMAGTASEDETFGVLLTLDILLIVVLAIMAAVGRKPSQPAVPGAEATPKSDLEGDVITAK